MFQCMKNVSFNTTNCLGSCEGILVNSFMKKRDEIYFGPIFDEISRQYNFFQHPTWLPPLLKSKFVIFFVFRSMLKTIKIVFRLPMEKQNSCGQNLF